MKRRPVLADRKAYYPYAALLEGDRAPVFRLVIGRARQTHDQLLKASGLMAHFDDHPSVFIMGRLRYMDASTVILDTASDLYVGKTGVERPLAEGSEGRIKSFEDCLRRHFKGLRIFLLEAGLRDRVSGLSSKRQRALITGCLKDSAVRAL